MFLLSFGKSRRLPSVPHLQHVGCEDVLNIRLLYVRLAVGEVCQIDTNHDFIRNQLDVTWQFRRVPQVPLASGFVIPNSAFPHLQKSRKVQRKCNWVCGSGAAFKVKMLMSRILCRVAPQQLRSSRLIATTMVRREVKTPVQEWGWAYLQKQKSLGRPIAPHLGAYKPPITMIVSGLHRITGCVMAGTLLLGGIGFALLPFSFTDFVEYIRSWHLHPIITSAFKWVIVFPISLHVLNGIRFIGFDLAKGMKDIHEIVRSGYLVLIVSAIIATAAVYMAWPTGKEPEKKH